MRATKNKVTAGKMGKTRKFHAQDGQFMVARIFDIILSITGICILTPLGVGILLGSLILQPGSPFYLQTRVGREEKMFTIIKFRTMQPGTNPQGTHLVKPGAITSWGKMLRCLKLDEIPQLWNVLFGEMSLVGPRPCLPNQETVILERRLRRVFRARPGITGLAQIMGVDMSTPVKLAEIDASMLSGFCLRNYFGILICTMLGSTHYTRRNSCALYNRNPPSQKRKKGRPCQGQ